MSKWRQFARQIPLLIIWLMASALIWGFVFTRITDTSRENKIVIFVDAETPGAAELEMKLNAWAREDIRMVQVRPFSYAMLDGSVISNADLYIVKTSDLNTYQDWFRPYPDDFKSIMPAWEQDGICLAQMLSSPLLSHDPYRNHIRFEGTEPYWLCFGANSIHLAGNEGAVDDEAAYFARVLLERNIDYPPASV